jgi:ferric-dicitrate binding protein FerR (iron transport regulator)
MNEEKLIGYIKGDIISESETVKILDWIESSPENQRQYNQLKNLWVVTGLDRPDQVTIPSFSFPKAKQITFQKILSGSILNYAAVFVLAFVLGSLSLYLINRSERTEFYSRYNTIEVPYGERSQISLYDGTKVWLNSGTKFRYPVAFSRDTRDVFIEGEAYFDVAKDAKHPFVVSAGRLKIKVLGTRFNVSAYPADKEFSTTLDEGSVQTINTINGKGVKMIPGEQVILNRETNEQHRMKVNTELYTSWKENLLKFEDAPFEEVIKKMERWYDVKILVDPSINTREKYTMTIKTESLREMLQLVSRTTKMNYEIIENTVSIKNP